MGFSWNLVIGLARLDIIYHSDKMFPCFHREQWQLNFCVTLVKRPLHAPKPYLANSHWGLGFRFISYLPITSAKQRNINRSWKGYIHRRYAALISLEQPGLTVSLWKEFCGGVWDKQGAEFYTKSLLFAMNSRAICKQLQLFAYKLPIVFQSCFCFYSQRSRPRMSRFRRTWVLSPVLA